MIVDDEQPIQLDIPEESGRVERATAALEALLFASPEGETVQRLASALGWPPSAVRVTLDTLQQELFDARRGIILQRDGDHAQLVTAPEFGPAVGRLLGLERTLRLSGAALETLALIAYRQPMTRAEIEAVRGVDSGSVISTLLARELILPLGRRAAPGMPIEYGTTVHFLQAFGLASLEDLPTLGDVASPIADRGTDVP